MNVLKTFNFIKKDVFKIENLSNGLQICSSLLHLVTVHICLCYTIGNFF